MTKFNSSKPAQLISGEGNLNEQELNFGNEKALVSVVSIIGPGTSTFVNKCFSTEFNEMKDELGRSTTKGIWMSKLSFPDLGDVNGHSILLLDCCNGAKPRVLQGNEVSRRKVLLFALASSDVFVINLTGLRDDGEVMPRIHNIFKWMAQIFSTPRPVTLLIVHGDGENKVNLEEPINQLITQLTEMWQTTCNITAPYTAWRDYFRIEVMALSESLHPEEAFNEQVVRVREMVFDAVNIGELNRATNVIRLSKKNWIDVQADNIPNLQINKNSVNEEFFNKIKDEIFQKFCLNKSWIQMKNDVRKGEAKGFGDFVSSLIDSHLSEFNEEIKSFRANIRDDQIAQLTKRLLEAVEDSYYSFLKAKKQSYLDNFEKEVKEKMKALDNNFSAETYTKGFFESLKEAHVKQANFWIATYESFAGVKSNIAHYVDYAHKLIEDRLRQKAEAEAKEGGGGSFIGKIIFGSPMHLLALLAEAIAPDSDATAGIKDADNKFHAFQNEFRSAIGLEFINKL